MRFNPLKSEWVLVSPHRTKRPWSGKVEDSPQEEIPEYDPKNPLCPGALRSNGQVTIAIFMLFLFSDVGQPLKVF